MISKLKRILKFSDSRRNFLRKTIKGLVLVVSTSPLTLFAKTKVGPESEVKKLNVKEKNFVAPKITGIDIYKLTIPYKEPMRISLGLISTADNLLVRIHTDSGIYGLGEGSPVWSIVGENQAIDFDAAVQFARLIKGKNPFAVEERMREIEGLMAHNTTVKSAFDMALYDLLGKFSNLPLYALLAGEKREFYTDLTIGINTPEVMAEKAVNIKNQGFPAIKAKVGTNKADDLARIQAIRKALGDNIPIRIDANQGWDYKVALNTLLALEPYGIQYCEQPVANWNYEALKLLREKTTIPIMADEAVFNHHDALKLAAMNACDYFNIKLSKSSGIHQALKINAIAEAAGIKCMLGCMSESRLALTACAHVVSARPNFEFADLDSALQLVDDPVIGGLVYDRGKILLPETPGHGADIDPTYLRKLEKISI